jgi:Ca-activated chloride channel family protein
MTIVRYHEYVPDLWDEIDLSQLVSELSDFLLASDLDSSLGGDDLDSLYDAILDAIVRRELLNENDLSSLLADATRLERFLHKLVERLQSEGFVTLRDDNASRRHPDASEHEVPRSVRFELTDKGVDFLGYRALRDLLGSLGRASFGRHDTRDLATGIESSAASKEYEFGDTLNLDVAATLLSALAREGVRVPIALDHSDLRVHQSEYQSSCATVVLLDCSHSMVLYGEDRFTPAKKVALALASLIRTQYPGDSLRLALFHDSAEEVPLSRLARVRVGPYHTNTREGLRLARRLLSREGKDLRQIVMITDGKPSALTESDGSVYKNPYGLDPRIIALTLKEVAICRRQGIPIHTFMLARDRALMAFVRKVSQISHGKAYFTTPSSLGRFVLMDYLNKRTRYVH